MEPKHLMQLAAILDSGSINAAAVQLNVTQPTLTRNIQTLEMQAGGSLFTRSRHGVKQTSLGATLAREGRLIAKAVWTAQQAAIRHNLGMKQEWRIGVGPLISNVLMHSVSARFLQNHPELSMLIRVDTPYRLIEQMQNEELDLVISPKVISATTGLTSERVFEDQLAVFASSLHPLAARMDLTLEDLNHQSWINVGTYARFGESPAERLQRAGVTHFSTPVALAGDAIVCLQLLKRGEHLSLLPRRLMRLVQDDYGLVELPLALDFGRRDIYFWYRTDNQHSVLIQQMREAVGIELSL
ncbi:MAG: LysR family transcriptional regulator [Saccharospirillum sp.]|nr:LysR family transcriptional regulator [Saccharospirillum sp.]